jgi:O-antigen ligase
MTNIVLRQKRIEQGALAPRRRSLLGRAKPIGQVPEVKWIIRYTFYAFIFSLPFEEAYIAGGTTLPKLFGVALAAVALLQPRLCYKWPPKVLWWFASYLLVFALWTLYLILAPPNVPDFSRAVIQQFTTLAQLLFLFWVSYNLLKHERVFYESLWAFTAASMILAFLQFVGVTSEISAQGRVTAFEGNPNGLATVLSLGLLALIGLAYGRESYDWKGRVFFWLGSGVLAVAMVQTGSRGTLLALMLSLGIFFLRGKSLATKLKFGAIALVGIVILGVASYKIEAVRVRWEKTFYDEDLAGRQSIYSEAIGMILERPLIGWGPVNHLWELGPRVGEPYRDEHNVYLWVLAESGLVGAIPFFAGLWLCWRAAWKGRHGLQGILPLVMLLFLLAASMKGTLYKNKYFWMVLAYASVSSTYGALRRTSNPAPLIRNGASRIPAYAPIRNRPRSFKVARSFHRSQ